MPASGWRQPAARRPRSQRTGRSDPSRKIRAVIRADPADLGTVALEGETHLSGRPRAARSRPRAGCRSSAPSRAPALVEQCRHGPKASDVRARPPRSPRPECAASRPSRCPRGHRNPARSRMRGRYVGGLLHRIPPELRASHPPSAAIMRPGRIGPDLAAAQRSRLFSRAGSVEIADQPRPEIVRLGARQHIAAAEGHRSGPRSPRIRPPPAISAATVSRSAPPARSCAIAAPSSPAASAAAVRSTEGSEISLALLEIAAEKLGRDRGLRGEGSANGDQPVRVERVGGAGDAVEAETDASLGAHRPRAGHGWRRSGGIGEPRPEIGLPVRDPSGDAGIELERRQRDREDGWTEHPPERGEAEIAPGRPGRNRCRAACSSRPFNARRMSLPLALRGSASSATKQADICSARAGRGCAR